MTVDNSDLIALLKQATNVAQEISTADKEMVDGPDATPPEFIAAMTVWGESRGETNYGKRCVAGVIYTRAIRRALRTGYPFSLSVSEVCLAPHQFSCWQNGKFAQAQPDETSPVWDACSDIAGDIFAESYRPLFVATHYYAPALMEHAPLWTSKMRFVCKIGGHAFFLEEGWRGVS